MRKKIFQLREAKIDEISFVTAPANKKKFLFKKSVSLDRISKGRIICSSCDHEEALVDFLKSASEECPQCGANLISSNSKILFGDKIMKLIKLFKSFLGDDEELVDEKELDILEKSEENIDKDVAKAIEDSLESLSEYSDDFPAAQKADIVALAKIAISEAGKATEKNKDPDDEDVKKTGAKLSKSTVTIIKSAISAFKGVPDAVKSLQGLIPAATEKADIEALVKTVETLTKAIEENAESDETKTKKEKDDKKSDLETQVSDIKNIVNKLAKAGGVKKSLNADEEADDDDDDEGKEKTKKSKWSFVIGGMPKD